MNDESKVKKILFNEISFLIAGVGLVSSLILWVTNPQVEITRRVDAIEQEVEHTSTDYDRMEQSQLTDLAEIKQRLTTIDNRQLELLQAVARLEARH